MNRILRLHACLLRVVLGLLLCVVALTATTQTAQAATSKPNTTATEHATFVTMAGKAAKLSQTRYGVPPSVTVAQAILESSWGTSKLATATKNHFGMKCFNKVFGTIANGCADSPTFECDSARGCQPITESFRVYKSVADSFADHGSLLHRLARYKPAFTHTKDANQFIREVHKAGYATDPKYSDKIISLMKQYNLYRFN